MRSVLVFAVLLAAIPANGAELKCSIRQKFVCEENGCRTAPATTWNLVDRSQGTYSRCDSRGCDKYRAQFSESGAFINIELPGRGLTAKMARDASTFHEVATLVHSVYVSFGSCGSQQ